jgi:acetate kinase
VDPGLFAWLGRELQLGSADIERSLGEQSGLLALAGTADFAALERRAEQGDAEAQLAIRVFAYRVCKYLGAYAAVLGGVDAVVFTGGIGENSALLRQRCCERLHFLGLLLDADRNAGVALDGFEVCPIHATDSRVQVLVMRSNEQWMIAQEVQQLLRPPAAGPTPGVRIPIAVSARHVHLSEAAVEALFGPGHVLQVERRLSQPEGWAAVETVQVCGPKGCLDKVRVLGPTRSATQIEVARTDTFTLGVEAPLRASGQLQGTPRVTLIGPAGRLDTDGLIVAARHIHMSPHDAGQLGLQDGQYVEVHVDSGERALTFDHTLVRIKDSYVTEMHIDTDEANAAGIPYRAAGELVIRTDVDPGRVVRRPSS